MSKRIMIVHHAPFMRNYIEAALKKLGYEVAGKLALGEAVRTGDQLSFTMNEEILPAYQKQKPDAVLMDSTMGGDQVTAKLLKADKKALVIGCSAELNETGDPNGFRAEQKKMLDAGAKATVGIHMTDPARFTEDMKIVLDQALKEKSKKWLGLF